MSSPYFLPRVSEPGHYDQIYEFLNQINFSKHSLASLVDVLIIYHDFLPTPRRGSHVKSDKTHTQSSRYTP